MPGCSQESTAKEVRFSPKQSVGMVRKGLGRGDDRAGFPRSGFRIRSLLRAPGFRVLEAAFAPQFVVAGVGGIAPELQLGAEDVEQLGRVARAPIGVVGGGVPEADVDDHVRPRRREAEPQQHAGGRDEVEDRRAVPAARFGHRDADRCRPGVERAGVGVTAGEWVTKSTVEQRG